MTHYVITITSNYIEQYFEPRRKLDNNTVMFDIAAEDFTHAVASLPPRLPDDAIVKLERTYTV